MRKTKFQPYKPNGINGGFSGIGPGSEYEKYQAHIDYFLDAVEEQGFWYAVDDYSDFGTIKDNKFQELLREFKKAGNRLLKYASSLNPAWEPRC